MSDKSESTALAAAPQPISFELDVQRVVAMRSAVEEIIAKVLREGEHYGVIPGTTQAGKKAKKALLQPGAEVLCQVFRLRPEYSVETREERQDFIMREVRCRLYNTMTGELVGEAFASANSREEKYLVQTAARLCPSCGKATIIKGKDEYGGGWLCFARKGGCGAKYADEDKKILDQTGSVSADKVFNLHHTIISIAQKRAYVKAVRNATATSDIFTDEEAPSDDGTDDEPRTSSRSTGKQPAGPKASGADIARLNDALVKNGIQASVDQNLPASEREGLLRESRFRWVCLTLEEAGETKPASLMALTADQVKRLIDAANSRKLPKGW